MNTPSTYLRLGIALLISTCAVCETAHGQLLQAIYTKGTIIQNTDTTRVSLYIPISNFNIKPGPDYPRMQRRMKYIDSQGKRIKLRPEDAQELVFSYDHEEIRMVSVRLVGAELTRTLFLRLIEDGKMRLFRYYQGSKDPMSLWSSGGHPSAYAMKGGAAFTSNKYVIQNENGKTVIVDQNTPLELLRASFSRCQSIVERVNSKEFSHQEITGMVQFYNAHCISQKN